MLSPALEYMRKVDGVFETRMTSETLYMAQKLIEALLEKKKKEVDRLTATVSNHQRQCAMEFESDSLAPSSTINPFLLSDFDVGLD